MGFERAEIRLEVITEIGASVEDGAEAAKVAVATIDGGRHHVDKVAPLVLQFHDQVEYDIDAGKFSEFEEPLKVAALVKTYLTRAHAAVESYKVKLNTERLVAVGRQEAMEKTVQNLSKLRESEQKRIDSARAARQRAAEHVASDDSDSAPRATGMHPGSTLKDRRLAEDAAPAQKKKGRKASTKKAERPQKTSTKRPRKVPTSKKKKLDAENT